MMLRKFLFSVAVVSVVILFSSAAFATLERILPSSSYYDGSTFYDEDLGEYGRLSGRIDFAVYDTDTYANEFIGNDGFEAPGERQYIYAYQIFNDYQTSEAAVNYFAIFGIDGQLLSESSITGLGYQNDSSDDPTEEGVEPSYSGFDNIESKVIWRFEDGYLEAGDHSWLLVFSSDQGWVEGDYEIGGVENPFPTPPGGENPEPTTLFLLTAGGGLLLTKRRKTIQ